jgi:cytoskeletal protein CcmA (bactofilin family)
MTVHSGAVIKGNIITVEIHIEKDAVIEGLISKSGIPAIIYRKGKV